MRPSSIVTGMATVTAFLHFERTLTMFSSIENARATFRSCICASSYGFSRRCETDSWTDTFTLLDGNAGFLPRRVYARGADQASGIHRIVKRTERTAGEPPPVGHA